MSHQPEIFYEPLQNPFPKNRKKELKVYRPYYREPKSKEWCYQRLTRRVPSMIRDNFISHIQNSTNLWQSKFDNFGGLPKIGTIENKEFPKFTSINALPTKMVFNDAHNKITNPGYKRNDDGKHFTS